MGTSPVRERVRRWLPWILVTVAVAATFGNTLGNGHVWDDFDIVVDNPETRDLASLPRVLLSPDLKPPYYRPLPRALFVLEYAAFGPSPLAGHAVSLGFHLAAALLWFAFARVLFRRDGPALAAALLWAVHPMASEAAGFISVRTTPMAMTFVLVTLLATWRGVRHGGTAWPWLAGLAFLAALGCKEQAAIALPLAALLLAYAGDLGAPVDPRRWCGLIPLGLGLAGYLAARVASLGGLLGDVPDVVGKASGMGMLDAAVAIGKYVAMLAWPAGLTVTHDLSAEAVGPLLGAFAATVALTAFVLARRAPARVIGIAWFWMAAAPTIQVVALPSSAFAERHAYLLHPGLILVLVDLAWAAMARRPSRAVAVGAGLVLALAVGALSVRAIVRNRDWRDNGTLFRSALAVRPSATAHFNLGNLARRQGDLPGAVAHWQAAVDLDPGDADALNQLGVAAANAGRWDEARDLFTRAVRAFPGHPAAKANLGILESRMPGRRPHPGHP